MALTGSEVAVTSLALVSVLRRAVTVVFPAADVVLRLPRTAAVDADPTVGLHLFRVEAAASPTPALAPRPAGAAAPRPRTWELDYVISFGGGSALDLRAPAGLRHDRAGRPGEGQPVAVRAAAGRGLGGDQRLCWPP